jgi:hypothetical protein
MPFFLELKILGLVKIHKTALDNTAHYDIAHWMSLPCLLYRSVIASILVSVSSYTFIQALRNWISKIQTERRKLWVG